MAAILVTLGLVLAGEGAPGDLDPTSGGGGTVITDFGHWDGAGALVLQPDGKLVAAGGSEEYYTSTNRFALARYMADGRLDPSFGVGGRVTTNVGSGGAYALVLQPDGKLVAAGLSYVGSGVEADFALARYLPDGHLDATFGTGGTVTTDFGGIAEEIVYALVLQPDGKLVAAGGTGLGFTLARYLVDGHLDATFGTGGTVTTDFGGSAAASALVLQPDGKLVAGGSNNAADFALARYFPNGDLDPTFGTGGMVTTDFGDLDFASTLILQPDGKLVAAGTSSANATTQGNVYDFALARYRPDGRLDATFGTGFEINVNALVTFEPLPATFTFTPDPTGCPAGFVGTFSFEARLTNISESALTDLVVAVTTLTHGNLLQNADGGPGGVGARLTAPQQDGFSDGVLSPDEFVNVPFIICLTQRQPFTFVVDVLGVVEASAAGQAMALP